MSSTELPESQHVEPDALREALDGILASSLRAVCVGLALFYALLSIWQVLQLDDPNASVVVTSNAVFSLGVLSSRTLLSASAGLFSFGLLAAAFWFERNQLPSRLAHPVASAISLAIIANCLLQIVASGEPRQTTHLMIAELGFGCLLLSMPWFVGLSALAAGGWALVAGVRTENVDWVHFGLGLAEAGLIGSLILMVRIRAYKSEQTLRLRDKVLMSHLKTANEEALVAVKAKSAFLANMSHEIRTPMTAMLGMTELLQMTPLDETQKEYTDTIARAGNTLLQLVNDILDFSKMEAGQLSIETIAFDLPEVLDEVRSMLAVKARQRGLTLAVEVQESMPRRLRGDPTRLQQVLVNLVGNAIKFTHKGGVMVEACATANLDGAWAVQIAVRDTGIGIAPEQLDRVFEAFTQADSSTTRKFGGTGLGLAISSQLARLMGGELRLESELERGSTFTLCLSLEEAERKSRVPSAAPPSDVPARHAHVLLVEDNLENQGMGKKLLEALGCTVEVANDGEEAVALIERQKFDLVFMDCNMPNMNGYDATREIRLREREGQHTVVVALSASVLPEERARCRDSGMDDFVAKPYTADDLRSAIDRWTGTGLAAQPARVGTA